MNEFNQQQEFDASSNAPQPNVVICPYAGKVPVKEKKGCLWAAISLIAGFIFICFAGFIILMIAGMAAGAGAAGQKYQEELISGDMFTLEKIAVLDISGIILSGNGSPMSNVADSDIICDQLKTLAADDTVKGVILYINSPGGEVTAADYIHNSIKELKTKRNIPVIAVMGSVAASGGYYVAAPCDYIIANRLTMTGSIGVVAQAYNYHELLGKIGVKAETYKSGAMKDMLSGSRPRTPEEVEIMQEVIDDIYADFLRIVAEGRPGLTVEKIKASPAGDCRILQGDQAKEIGLVDQLGYFDDGIKKAVSKAGLTNYKVVRFKRTFSFAQLFAKLEQPSRDVNVNLPGSDGKFKLEAGKFYFLPQGW